MKKKMKKMEKGKSAVKAITLRLRYKVLGTTICPEICMKDRVYRQKVRWKCDILFNKQESFKFYRPTRGHLLDKAAVI